MTEYYVFCDGSLNPQAKVGVAAILLLSHQEWEAAGQGDTFPIQTRILPSSSIAQVELMAAIWALSDPRLKASVTLFTDCKTIHGLPARREKLRAGNYQSKRTGLRLNNADLYEEFFSIYDKVQPTIEWVKGHSPKTGQTQSQRIFSFVDKAARKTLREQK